MGAPENSQIGRLRIAGYCLKHVGPAEKWTTTDRPNQMHFVLMLLQKVKYALFVILLFPKYAFLEHWHENI